MIREALGWEKGTRENPKRHDVGPSGGPAVYFMKPGKEAFRRTNPKPNDMTPLVGTEGKRYRFQDMWVPIASLSLFGGEIFKPVLTLLYRNTFLLDHVPQGDGLRYRPQGEVMRCISELDGEVRKVWPSGLMEMLCLFDVLGWNEDVKYHSENESATFAGEYGSDVGRTNNMLTGVAVVWRVGTFVDHVIKNAKEKESIDMTMIIEPMQTFANRRGVAPPSDDELRDWLRPYIID